MVAHLSISVAGPQPVVCPAKEMGPQQRQDLALHALAGTETISRLAAQGEVSRKFVYQQVACAKEALQSAFHPPRQADEVLFHLPVTKAWLDQRILGLTLTCHSPLRGVVEFCRDLLDWRVSLGKVHNVLQAAVAKARGYNREQDLSAVRIGAHDEIFQSGRPVLVGADIQSTYCYLLSLEEHRDGDTWGVRLLELQEQGFHPEATIADAGRGLRAGQAQALSETPCRGDVFHALQLLLSLVTFLENRAYEAIATRSGLEQKKAKAQRRGQRTQGIARQASLARQAEAQAIALAEDVALLADWLCRHRIGPAVRALANQRDDLLAFAARLDQDLAALALRLQLPLAMLREVFNTEVLELNHPARWPREAALRQQLGGRFFAVRLAVEELAEQTVRARSILENLNSRLRSYFFLRRHLGPDYLSLLQFYLNHHRFLRSERAERTGKSPAELLTGQPHPHWLEMLPYTRFSRN